MKQEKLCIHYQLKIIEEQKQNIYPMSYPEHKCSFSFKNTLGQMVEIKTCAFFKDFNKCEYSNMEGN